LQDTHYESIIDFFSFNLRIAIIRSIGERLINYEGNGSLLDDSSLLIKYTGNPQRFLDELHSLHVQNPEAVKRTESSFEIPSTNKPMWVYGSYSVYAILTSKDDYVLIEVIFSAYNRPGNYKMLSAPIVYQEIVNRLPKK
jgi:hypothetical protein